MGIRSMLRKVFGRDREESPATSVPPQTRETPEAVETAETVAPEAPAGSAETGGSTETGEAVEPRETAEPREAPETAARRAADDLVAAAFDNPQIPRARTADDGETGRTTTASEPSAAAEPVAEASAEPAVEPVAEEPAEAVDAATPEAEEATADAAAETTVTGERQETAEPEEAAADEARAEADVPATPEAAVATDADTEASDTAVEAEAEIADEPQTEAAAPAEPETQAQDVEVATDEARTEAVVVADDTDPAEPEADEPQAEAAAPAEPEAVEAADESTAPADPVAAAAEPEAQAVETQAVEVAAADAPAEEARAQDTAPAPTPALPLAAVKAAAPHLADAYKAAGAQLKKQGLTGARAAVYLVVDRSGSMRGYFKDGSVQRLAEQVTALAAHLDEDATVTTVFFSTDIDGTVDLTPADLTPTRIEEINGTLGRLGRTNYHRAVEEVLAHHEKADPARPALVVFQTDGAPESRTAATQALAEAAEKPLNWRFVVWGEEDNKAFDYLRKLDGTPRTSAYFAGVTPVEATHAAFFKGLLAGLEL
ncbi:VWA domain-containing protein [Streptomyces sp. NPDC053513]|uniref:VWA domain-containing protein n=1 Tax=unclassified Streptomyces TaxID=2593676 RepID=UPI0037D45ACE